MKKHLLISLSVLLSLSLIAQDDEMITEAFPDQMSDLPADGSGAPSAADPAPSISETPAVTGGDEMFPSNPGDTTAGPAETVKPEAPEADELFSDQDTTQAPQQEAADLQAQPSSELPGQEVSVEQEQGAFARIGGTDIADPDEPGSKLEPSEKFSRVPLRPPMSDKNWNRYAGRSADKLYRVKKGDSLWVISERLFGNPHLWPKIWQLNARLGNAHQVSAGTELLFTPGNPYAAPILAFKRQDSTDEDEKVPLTGHLRERSLLDRIREGLAGEFSGPALFRNFMLGERPKVLARFPEQKDESARLIYGEGTRLSLSELAAGKYAIIRVERVRAHGKSAWAMNWLGRLEVTPYDIDSNPKNALVERSFEEIYPGDLIVRRDFALNPLPLHDETLGRERRGEVKLFPLDSTFKSIVAQNVMLGAKFRNEAAGPSLGAVVGIVRDNERIGTAVLIDRQQDVGTFWVLESKSELSIRDHVE
jgi:hypothetical protein